MQKSISSQLIRGLASGVALISMVIACDLIMMNILIAGLSTLLFGILMYAWSEDLLKHPKFSLVPCFWISFCLLFGPGLKGDNILLGAFPLLLLISYLRRDQKKAQTAKLENET